MTETELTDEARAERLSPAQQRQRKALAAHDVSLVSILAKTVLLGLVTAAAGYAIIVLALRGEWIPAIALGLATILINAIYIPANKLLPAKYLTPGMAFLLVFQVAVITYTVYIAFTNYGDGHNGSKQDAITAIQRNNLERVPDSPAYPATILDKDGALAMAVIVDGTPMMGDNDTPLAEASDAVVEGDRVASVPGYSVLQLGDMLKRQQEVTSLSVPRSDDTADGDLRTQDGSTAYVYTSQFVYDEQADTFTNSADGTVYRDNGEGSFATDDGKRIEPGWMVGVGFDNFARAFSDESIRGPFLAVTLWTFAFAILSVLTTFALGLFFALILNHPKMKSTRIYRTLLIIPYAFPAFLSALVWAGMFNPTFGYINQELLGGASIDWLNDPWLAKGVILFVNLWLGYPYMFLVSTGALQAIPDEAIEAARVDGATGWQIFRTIQLPLLLVPLAPLLISSFAFNFNNFILIYFLTGGGPRFSTTGLDIGHTDILISMVYKVAVGDLGRDFGLASAFSILIFIIVGVISWISFRQTKSLEEVN